MKLLSTIPTTNIFQAICFGQSIAFEARSVRLAKELRAEGIKGIKGKDAEKLVASIEDDIDPQITESHLAEVKKRRDEIRSGKVKLVNGEEGLPQVRAMIEK